ncbi:DUF4856 domain-containing protein [Cellulophaga sp. HaHaR_3_176]|uniref:DUF4856 domain-containing protein n=1 Tax=Cellulophaga sp. HaHaR_3_176 TaxID=1942464 RepID=UPI001C1F7444|nr:DUF4856 domain-containing protein [Cellulophaga sp. HaHaR_3_176]QWX82735.1 DUF4856 domain-containing protein [Cellulophaga sp. HaHaR_3_176]
MKKLLLLPLCASLLFVSCDNDDNDSVEEIEGITNPSLYMFERDGISTVSFDGQTTRILMAGETVDALRAFDTATETSLNAMFAHEEGANDFSDTALNSSDKSLRSKVAASSDFFAANTTEAAIIKADFEGYIAGQINEVFPNENTVASAGVAGQIADGTSTRYVNANGLEYNQMFAKSLLGALMTDQILNNYLSTSVLDAESNRENNDNDVLEDGKTYTSMEHKWDEAYGYIYGTSENIANPNLTIGEDDKFLNEYTGRVNDDADFSTIASEIFEAFKLGRAAIVAKQYDVRDEQAEIIREKISEVIAVRGIYYLQQAKTKIVSEERTGSFHALSEAYGFVYSLRFTRKPGTNTPFFSKEEVDGLLLQLLGDGENGLWDLEAETIEEISEAIAAKFDFTVAQAASVE